MNNITCSIKEYKYMVLERDTFILFADLDDFSDPSLINDVNRKEFYEKHTIALHELRKRFMNIHERIVDLNNKF